MLLAAADSEVGDAVWQLRSVSKALCSVIHHTQSPTPYAVSCTMLQCLAEVSLQRPTCPYGVMGAPDVCCRRMSGTMCVPSMCVCPVCVCPLCVCRVRNGGGLEGA